MPQWTLWYMYLFNLILSLSLDIYRGLEFLDHMIILFLVFLSKLCTVFHSGCTKLHSQQQCTKVPFISFSSTFVVRGLFDDSHSLRYNITFWFWFAFLGLLAMLNMFMCLLAICISSLEKSLFRSSAHLKKFF